MFKVSGTKFSFRNSNFPHFVNTGKQIGVVTAAGPSTKENAYTRRLTVGLLDSEKDSLVGLTSLMGSQNVIDVDYAREHIGEKIM